MISEEEKRKLSRDEENKKIVTMDTVIHDVDEILLGLSEAIEEKRQESQEKMKKKKPSLSWRLAKKRFRYFYAKTT